MKRIFIACLAVMMVLATTSCGFKIVWDDGKEDETEVSTSGSDTEEPADAYFDYMSADLDEYITLGKYKGLNVPLTISSEITDADMNAYIDEVRAQHVTLEEVTGRACKSGDTVVVDFAGTVDGVAFEGGTAENQTLALGAGGFIPGFEEGIIGMQIGESKTIQATFPEDYGVDELNGKTADFLITLHSISEYVTPEYNQAFVSEKLGYDTMAEYEEYVNGILKENRSLEIENEKASSLLSLAAENSELLKYPEGVVESYVSQDIEYAQYYATIYGMEYEDFISQALGQTVAEYEAEITENAQQNAKRELVIYAIVKAENLEVTDEEYETELAGFLEYYGYDTAETFMEDYGITEDYLRQTVEFSLYYNKIISIMMESATFTGAN